MDDLHGVAFGVMELWSWGFVILGLHCVRCFHECCQRPVKRDSQFLFVKSPKSYDSFSVACNGL